MVKTMYHGYGGEFEITTPMLFTDRKSAEWFAYAEGSGHPMLCEASVIVHNPATEEDLLQAIKEVDVYDEDVAEHNGNGEFLSNYLFIPAVVDNLRVKGFDSYESEEILTNSYYSFTVIFDVTQIELHCLTPLTVG